MKKLIFLQRRKASATLVGATPALMPYFYQMKHRHSLGFSLVELLTIMAIMAILALGSATAISGVMSAGNMNSASTQMEGLLEQARAYAMAKNTYVFVGLEEVAATQSPAATPQAVGVGRVAVGIAATTTGMTPDSSSASYPNITTQLQAISKLQILNNVHLGDLTHVASGNMARTTANTVLSDDSSSGIPQATSALSFTWPVTSTAAQYTFQTVLQFDPQGVASFQPSGSVSTGQYIVPLIELGLQPVHGASVAPLLTGAGLNCVALQIQGVTGRVQVYRP